MEIEWLRFFYYLPQVLLESQQSTRVICTLRFLALKPIKPCSSVSCGSDVSSDNQCKQSIGCYKKHKGCDVAWALFWALKKVLKRVKPLKKGLSRVNLLFWALRKVLKRADLLKIVLNWEVLLKRGLNWVGHSKKGSREERSNSKEGSGLNWVRHSKKC